MRRYRCTLMIDGRSVDYELQARDYWDAKRLIEAQFPGREYHYLTEC